MVDSTADRSLARLALFDPDLAAEVASRLAEGPCAPDETALARLVDEILWAATVAEPLGRVLACGGAELLAHLPADGIADYWGHVHAAAVHGPELGRLIATALVPVMRFGPPPEVSHFLGTVAVLRTKGNYTLKRPLEALATLLRSGDTGAATVFLDLLQAAFDQPLTYNQSLHLSYALPKAAMDLQPPRRTFQLEQIRRIVQFDFRLVDDFLDGLTDGLNMLDAEALYRFVAAALLRCQQHHHFGRRMLALKTEAGRDALRALQRAVSLAEVRPALGRYLTARTGATLAIRSLNDLAVCRRAPTPNGPTVCSDGRSLYLPQEMDALPTRAANVDLYKLLVRIEAGHYECGTLDFDLARLDGAPAALSDEAGDLCELERFFGRFAIPELVEDLFTIAEHGRLVRIWQREAPGLWRASQPRLQEALGLLTDGAAPTVLNWLYRMIVLCQDDPPPAGSPHGLARLVQAYQRQITAQSRVEAAGRWAMAAYAVLAPWHEAMNLGRLVPPFGWRVPAALFGDAHRAALRTAAALGQRLAEQGAAIYRSVLVRELLRRQGRLGAEEMAELLRRPECRPPGAAPADLSLEDLMRLVLPGQIIRDAAAAPDHGPAAWYPEWDQEAAGYLADHVRVADRPVALGSGAFYPDVLARQPGLVARMRRAFELLRPQGVAILRQWIEGDDFDYRALVDYAVDRCAGVAPSERLYIKRVKKLRDVAVLLLVDLSRSTGNPVPGGGQAVVGVEKEAIVLFCEALSVVGDRFALAGFSGSGRLGVDYFRIKEFDEGVSETVRRRIDAVAPQRATRMGAAIRHATRQLAAEAARVRLLIILGDGFPNDVDYKGDHAVADTRQAVGEAQACGIHTHAITVNLPTDARLDDLYGQMRHTLIGDVRELPDKLLGIYGRLTR